jgi:lipoate-protein ligase A
METWRLLISPADYGTRNLATDQAISEQVRDGASLPTLRFYSWKAPTLSLGYAQPISLVDTGLARRLKIEIVRRSTGGQAILHDDELTYSIALPRTHAFAKKGIMASYQLFNNAFARGLNQLGIPVTQGSYTPAAESRQAVVCFGAPSTHELATENNKVLGSAQTRVGGVMLQHGSFPLSHNSTLHDLLRQPRPSSWQGLRDLLAPTPTLGALIQVFTAALADELNMSPHPDQLTDAETEIRDSLVRKRYECASWLHRC